MPHSSGGSSHRGGSHGGSHRSHSSRSHSRSSGGGIYVAHTPRRTRSAPFEGCRTFIYYKNKKPVYVYSDYDISEAKSKLGLKIFTLIFWGIIGLIIWAFIIAAFSHIPKKLTVDYNSAIIIEDHLGVIDNEDELRASLKNFNDETGITPMILTDSNDAWEGKYNDIEEYAYTEYVGRFKDEKHWLIVYTSSVQEDGFTDWYTEGMQGDDTDSILTYSETKQFNDTLYKYLLQSNKYSVGEALALTFDECTERVSKFYTYPKLVLITLGLYVLYMGFVVFCVDFNPKRDLYYPKSSEVLVEVIKEEPCEYCGGVYVIGVHEKCPHCGAAVKAHDFIKDESGRIIKIL